MLAVSFNASSDPVIFAGIDNDIKVWDTRMIGLLYKMAGHTGKMIIKNVFGERKLLSFVDFKTAQLVWNYHPMDIS